MDKINVQCDDFLFPFLLLFYVGNYVKKRQISFISNITFIEIIAKKKRVLGKIPLTDYELF